MPRFIHFMFHDSPVFNRELIRLINDGSDASEHLFLIRTESTLKCISESYSNVVHQPHMKLSDLQKYDGGDHVLILHSLFLDQMSLCRMSSSLARKIVWCVWGHDLYTPKGKWPVGRLKYFLANRKISSFKAIAAGFKYDEAEVRSRYAADIPVFNALYPSGYFSADVDRLVSAHRRTDMRTNIMVGHSGFPFLQHEKCLEQLLPYKDENIVITLILSYGEARYIERVVERAEALFGAEKLHIIRDFIPWKEYVDLLCDVDIAIFDYEHQAAFGNLILLSYLGKKLFLSPSGVMFKAFRAEQAEVYPRTELGRTPFEALTARPEQGSVNRGYAASLLDKQNIANQWRLLFQAM